MTRKIILSIAVLWALLNFASLNRPAYCASELSQYLCEVGIGFYEQGKYDDALLEFEKSLMLDPDNVQAKYYRDMLFDKTASDFKVSEAQVYEPQIRQDQEEILEPGIKRIQAIYTTLDELEKRKEKTAKGKEITATMPEKMAQKGAIKISGEAQLGFGVAANDVIWKKANADLNERNWRMLSTAAYDNKFNTYDARIYDRLRLNLDTQNKAGFNFHSNLTIDPWSYTGKSSKFTAFSLSGDDSAQLELKYWSNTRYTINETIFTGVLGNSFNLPEIKVSDKQTHRVILTGVNGNNIFIIPAQKINFQFQPLRELWFDYVEPEYFKLRFFPIAYQDQALTSDDPLMLSNHHSWWEDSPWLSRWLPGRINTGATPDDFTKGKFDNSLSFFTRDSDGTRLTALRGLSFDFLPTEKLSITSTFASPKGLWQDYDNFDNASSATRVKYALADNLSLGGIYTYRFGLTESESKRDMDNHVFAMDLGFEPIVGTKLSLEAAASQLKQDLATPEFTTRERGNAYYISLLGAYPQRKLMDLEHGYFRIKPDEFDSVFFKYHLYASHMDEGFNPALSDYTETRRDSFWSRHIHFRKPYRYYYSGMYFPNLAWDDIEPFKIGDGIDSGRDALGFRIETLLFQQKLENLFDVRNVHKSNGKFVENVVRDELSFKATDKLTAKALGIYHKLPKSVGGVDPFIVDATTGLPIDNAEMPDGKNVSINTGSLGAEYAFTDWLSLSGIWERTNDYNLAYDNFPRGLLNETAWNRTNINGRFFRFQDQFLYQQALFPLPPYHFYDIFKTGLRFSPLKNLELYLDYTRNEFKSAGQIDDNMNHAGIEIGYTPLKKFGFYFRYTYSRWNDLNLMRTGNGKYYFGHHNVFAELRYNPGDNDEFIMQYGESGRSPVAISSTDPFGGSLMTLDTQHIFRFYYRRRF